MKDFIDFISLQTDIDWASIGRWILRTLLVAIGPLLASYGIIGADAWLAGIDQLVGILMVVIGIAWNWIKYKQRKELESK